MTLVTLPFRPVAGDPEDVAEIMADFDAVLAVLNGDIRNDNIAAAAAIAVAKLAAGAADTRLETVAGVPTWAKVAKAEAKRANFQASNHAAFTALAWDTEVYDNDTMVDIGGGTPSRIVAKTAGLFAVHGQVLWAANVNGVRLIEILKNGGTSYGTVETGPAATGVDNTALATSFAIPLAVNDYIEIRGYQSSGGNVNIIGSCSIYRVGV